MSNAAVSAPVAPAARPATPPAPLAAAPALTGRAGAIALGVVPRAARVPADVASGELEGALSPMQATFRHFGSLNVRMIDHISDMIAETLASRGLA
jgi:hypothetical protein